MAPHKSKPILQRTAVASKLVTQEQLAAAIAAARQPVIGPPTPLIEVSDDQLAKQLVKMGYVTNYQAEQLKAGRTKLTLGPYIITDWIAQGGMGQVFKAEHEMMGREVAIKVLPHSRSTPQSIANFTREIRTQAILDHDNLVRAFDAGHDGNVYFLVTEYVRGTDLRRYVRSQGALTMEQAASLVLQAAVGLQHAHDKGLIHRDVKPGNILVTPGGKAKVSDLGLAGFLMSTAEEDPRKNKIVGTADYISPEQITSPENVTPTSDVYSLGCTLYYAITGKVPFPGGTTKDKARRHCEETPWHPRRFNQSVDDEFVDLIADMMEKNPVNRVATAEEVATRLEPWAMRAGPMPRQQPTRSPWMPPPLPAGSSDADDDLQATQEGSYEDLDVDSLSNSRSHLSSTWQGSQTTDGTSSQDTHDTRRRKRRPPLLPIEQDSSLDGNFSPRYSSLFIALAIAVPLSMILGALITLLAMLMAMPPGS